MGKRFKVLIVERIHEAGVNLLSEIAEVKMSPDTSQETLEKEAKDVDTIVIGGVGLINERLLDKAPRLKVVGRIGVSVLNIDVVAGTKRGIAVVYSGEANSDTVADLTIGLMLDVARNISRGNSLLKIGVDRDVGHKLIGTDVWNKTLGVVGFGRIGSRVVKRAQGFDMRVLVYDSYVEDQKIKEAGATPVGLRILLEESDFITVHTPSETKRLISEEEIKIMKDGVFIINSASGGIVDEQALYKALVNGKVAGAALDVFETKMGSLEIDLKKPLYHLDNVIVTPFLGAMTKESVERMATTTAEGVIKVLKGERPPYIVNPSVLK